MLRLRVRAAARGAPSTVTAATAPTVPAPVIPAARAEVQDSSETAGSAVTPGPVRARLQRRAVIVADAPSDTVTARPDLDDAVVRLSGRVGLDQVVAVYVDNAAAEPAVRAAIAVIDEADLGDEDAELTVGDAQDHDLAWYAAQELPFLLELL